MKLQVLAAAAALALASGAFAQASHDTLGKKADRAFDRAENATARTVNPPPREPSLGQRAGRVFDRMEEGTRRTWNRITGKAGEDHRRTQSAEVRDHDTRSMGAAPARDARDAREGTDADSPRRARMDDAYRNWQQRQR